MLSEFGYFTILSLIAFVWLAWLFHKLIKVECVPYEEVVPYKIETPTSTWNTTTITSTKKVIGKRQQYIPRYIRRMR